MQEVEKQRTYQLLTDDSFLAKYKSFFYLHKAE